MKLFFILLIGLNCHSFSADLIDFDQALDRIVQRSPTVQKQRSIVDAIKARNTQNHLRLLPTISIEASQNFSRLLGADTTTRSRNIEGKSTLNILHFGADLAGMRAASRDEEAAQNTYLQALIDAEENGITALLDYFGASMEHTIQKQIVDLKEIGHHIAKERYSKGLMPAQEVDKIAVDLANEEARRHDVEIAESNAGRSLAVLLGNTDVNPRWPWTARFSAPSFKVPQFQLEDLPKRPDWQSAEKKLEASEARIKEGFGKMLPSLDTEFTYGYSNLESQGRQGTNWTGMFLLRIPLFDRLENYGEYKARVHEKGGIETELELIKRKARQDFESAKRGFDLALASALARDKTASLSRKLYQDNLLRFRKGLANANELALDQRRLYESELSAIKGWNSAHTQYSKLCHSVGRRIRECGQDPVSAPY